ncbi:hypothetical protein D6C86_06414 [Aureobasidium pullulans]|nr:hypothetical protein D6D02_01249 [Aureobasidium pullulans]THZ58435.1 hypothetical protein D6C86_06414 [Aureobasidium pullulans]THZ95938.1 hypothetical protein D6C88_01764 [Aureobasidium pullulans]
MAGSILRNWFVPKDGINRQVISADIQKYLGNDATVRPGKDKVNNKEIEGYWIKAYRNLTSEMINDLRMASTKWEQEQRSGRRGAYEDSHTYRQATNTGPPNGNGAYRASTNSPQLDGAYLPPNGHVPPHVAQRIPIPDMASSPYEDPRSRMYGLPPHSGAPVTTGFGDPSMYASHQPRQAPNGYAPPGEFYNGPPGYAHDVPPPHMRNPPQYPPQYPPGHRDPRDEIRYAQEYQDPRGYANYPPVSVAQNGGASSPQTTSNYPQPRMPPQYDQYGRPYAPPAPMPDQSYTRPSPSVDSSYGRERPSAPPGADRGAPRRRIN